MKIAKEKVIGWYSSGPRIRPADLEINELFRKYTPNPVFVIIDVRPLDSLEIPTNAYVSVEEVREVKKNFSSIFLKNSLNSIVQKGWYRTSYSSFSTYYF